jgi:RNA polymerase sigma-70 factor (ECF subfamily)
VSWLRKNAFLVSSKDDDQGAPSLEALVSRHYAFVWRLLRGFGLSPTDAEDAAQQVFVIAARKLADIAPERARSFLYGTTRRVANNVRRGIRRRREVPDDDATDAEEPEPRGPEQMAAVVQARELLGDLLNNLPEELRRVLVLAEIEQIEVQEIAELEGLPVGTAASRLRRAREQFRVLLEAQRDRNPFARER